MTTPNERKLPPEELAKVFRLDPETGLIYWRIQAGRGRPGAVASIPFANGEYMRVRYRGLCYGAHRVAWCLHYGKWPEKWLDHINGNPNDGRISNLREATQSQNMANARRKQMGKNPTGTRFLKRTGKWSAVIRYERKAHHLGTFDTAEDASRAYVEAAKRLHGEFARFA